MTLPRLLLLLILLFSNSAFARMYQWVEPDTGTTQLSGKPPAWYRSEAGGPRVLVFENGRLIDDTDIEVARELRRDLRKRAFIIAEQDRQLAKEKLVRAREIKEKYLPEDLEEDEYFVPETEGEEEVSASSVLRELEKQKAERSEEEINEEEEMAKQMREMILKWERQQTEDALKQLD